MADDPAERVVNEKQLAQLLNNARRTASARAEASGELGATLRRWQESHNLHLAAFKVIAKLDAMDAERREQWLRHFQLYCDLCEERWPKHVGDLEDRANAAEETEREQMAEKRSKKRGKKGDVVPFKRTSDVELEDERPIGEGPTIIQ